MSVQDLQGNVLAAADLCRDALKAAGEDAFLNIDGALEFLAEGQISASSQDTVRVTPELIQEAKKNLESSRRNLMKAIESLESYESTL